MLSTPDRMPDDLGKVILNVRWGNVVSSLTSSTAEENVNSL